MKHLLIPYGIWALVIVLALLFLLVGSDLDFDYVIPQRLMRLAAIGLAGICIAVSAVTFQTLAGNRLLTPAIMGYEAVYLLLQAILVLTLGSQSLILLDRQENVLLSLLFMLGYSWIVHRWLFREGQTNLYQLLLAGLVLTMVLGTFTQFIQLKTSPGEFSILQGFSYATFNRVQPGQLLFGTALITLVGIMTHRRLAVLDVLSLGRDQAISLGVDYRHTVRLQLALIAVLVAVSTSLVGPTAFMGVFVANITYALARTFRHRVTLPLGCAIAIAIFIVAQFLVEQLFNYRTTVSILINLVCGTYFLALMVKTKGTP
ncbi:iron ABC transporter permease [Aeromonas salmonicida subsp. salmonicida]|uniref:ABC-type ferric siderophore transporter, permease protein n=2 Tax=Aeromonas salmonicida subsp. salmonicida TaxID=29491 RepID=A4STR4_AERS4|nr:iron chelate uptake ABC transporter family permease subunit [Aeromonas salmonicida]GAJ47136.1 putative ferric siderophore ABC transporter permease protein [Aeromonas salmonicida subsp. masoucida NBRC 13784]ABO92286.1 ABC-type ferric siderophore transporter, permease protein [Aeromonas salmonicida subsp. salmonicida A449]ASI25262.1 iron ABC transporter permease [Aeromonas salmonicida]ASI29581.1 iron ABC transporter permease [Aeromonas salmonicida]ASI33712.1 iron ABC transporter permease [Aer